MTDLVERLRAQLCSDDPIYTNGVTGPRSRELAAYIERAASTIEALSERIAVLEGLLNTPEVDDFAKGSVLEAAHQRERWGADHDAGKSPFDWFWLVGYLSQKAAAAAVAGDTEKAKHHTISTAAALANWHLALSGTDTHMRPGIDPERVQNGAGGSRRPPNDPVREQAA